MLTSFPSKVRYLGLRFFVIYINSLLRELSIRMSSANWAFADDLKFIFQTNERGRTLGQAAI